MRAGLAVMMTRRQLLLAAAASVFAACGRQGGATDDRPAQIAVDSPLDSYFVGPDDLAAELDDPQLRLLDLSPLPDFRGGHIPRARHVWWQDTIERHNPVYGMLVNARGRQQLVEEVGITSDSNVVCYDRSGGVYAARLIWVLHYMGFRDARLLRGGLQGWRASGRNLTLEPADPSAGGITDIFDESIISNAEDIQDRRDHPGLVILDTRTKGERRETWRDALRRGKIPGSLWLPRDSLLTDGSVPALIDANAIRERLSEAGVDLDQTAEVIVYGLHGTLASLPYLALTALDSFHVRLYDGSWADWGSSVDLPVDPIE